MRQLQGPRDLPAIRRALAEKQDPLGILPRLPHGEMFWVTRDMTGVALDASHDLPDWTIGAAMPSLSGLLAWQGDLPAVTDELVTGQPVPMRTIAWGVRADLGGRVVTVMVLTDRHPLIDGLVPVAHFSTALGSTVGVDARQVVTAFPEAVGVASLVGATWILMREPHVVERRALEPARRDGEAAARDGLPHPLVTTVDLRPLRTVTDPDAERDGERRRVRVRHVVRGHWRQQYYASTDERRPKWIHSYLKGPEGAPLRVSEKVMVWRR